MFNPPKGIIAYAVTPFSKDDNSLDLDAFDQVTEHLLFTAPSAISFLGSAGESAYLSEEEWQLVALKGVQKAAKHTPVIIGISELTTSAAIRKAQYAEKIGADALMIIPISYWKLSEQEIFDYFAAIAEKTSLPIMAYNNPSNSGLDMSPSLLLKLVREIDNITMIKESSGDIQRMHTLFYESHGEIPFYNGSNILALEALAAGAIGWCSAAPNLIDRQPAALYETVAMGNLHESRKLFYSMLPLLRFIVNGGLATTVKAGLILRGLNAGVPRHPLKPLEGKSLEELRRLMSANAIKVGV
ncbi:TPA: dihydrodipicolinate synthase family protein [Legionella pneumophila]|nr:dihydrodipicolinate synthase family protein [Legionella pneumophila]HAT8868436.1 dihydrodipicolinate synthase family protein [Legionella pneumophila subsp. pneumophila]HAT8890522.1 dihydrodipicolinate synthase family protein [Legionella pneumophila subsp. pneumophila]HAT8933543.1 dihydrodipicolinate synthase family protein [Legionella pneumophila subsp. pneumophila]HAU0162435.1 dihydrodipicolinate synthase family protein [Legionella pneumophila]